MVALRVVRGELGVLEGAHLIAALDLHLPDDDEDLATLRLVESETDALPIGRVRVQWADEALRRKEEEMREAELWARGVALTTFKSLAARFHVA